MEDQEEIWTAHLATDRAASLTLIARLADDWNARWTPESRRAGRLRLPVLAGVRRGWVEGRLAVEVEEDERSKAIFQVEKSEYRVQKGVVAILLFSGWAGLVILLVPVFPRLLALLPVCFMILIGAWLFIVGALRNSGPEEFFEMLEADSHLKEEEEEA